jgi:short/branched chain acyl-CoA dehydrogenase
VDLSLSEEQAAFQRLVREFAEEVVAPNAAATDEREAFPLETVRAMGELGLFGIPFPEEVGGQGGDLLMFCLALEEIGRYDSSVAITLEAAVGLAANPLFRYGTAEQHERWLGPLVRGEALGAFALTEPGGGSDAKAVRTTAKLDGGEWVIDGAKAFITNSGTEITSLVIVAARDDEAGGISTIVVPSDSPGLIVGTAYRKVGWRASDTHEVAVDGVRVPTTCSASAGAGTRSSSRRSPTAASRSRRCRSASRAAASRRASATRPNARRSAGRSASSKRCSSRSRT